MLRNIALQRKTFLKALGEYDRKREPCDKTKLRDYRLWQAVWASKYDKSGARIPKRLIRI